MVASLLTGLQGRVVAENLGSEADCLALNIALCLSKRPWRSYFVSLSLSFLIYNEAGVGVTLTQDSLRIN